jgi:hypothetical protein
MMDTENVFLILLDISGYTKFIKLHKISLLHAERIVDELLECVIAQMHHPLIVQELEGDAVYLYALSDNSPNMARQVSIQVERGIAAFKAREAELISECSLCICEACKAVGRLSIKALLHHGQVVFTRVREFTKLSGEDVILVHRLLKNSIVKKEYVLVTEDMFTLLRDVDDRVPEVRMEDCGDLGRVKVMVYYPSRDDSQASVSRASLLSKLKMLSKMEWHLLKRLLMSPGKRYHNLDIVQH